MATNTDIPQGYKATALGIIPQEWEVTRLEDLCHNQGDYGINAPATDFSNELPTYLRITDIDDDGKFIIANKASVNNPNSRSYHLKDGDIVFARTGATVGKTYLYNREDGDLVFAGFLIRFSPDQQKITPYYLKAYTNTSAYWKWVKITSQRSGQPGINATEYCSLQIPVPPLAEQRKIAEVLGVWDEAIEKQARLIEKLALRKRALMQRLLSAKLRLPGFSEPWKKVNYSDILKEVRRTLTWDENELYDLISVRRRSGGVFHRESLYGHEIKTKTLRPALEGDFLISKMQIVHGASGVVPKQLSGMKISGSYIALIAKDPKELNINYFNLWSQMPLFYHQTFVSSYGVHIEKMTFDLDAFMSLSMNLPPIEEQNRIVEVISTATNEIELAKEKLERLRRQKRGLMQQLLTGKKRVKY
ncbi:restriction endonuclease subunit S [uncultured Alistipes sp.]|uniref:restriction endonuclease subunit S n=1 Tax=uncultured Alistipes sp. TaxID=538949 RepID=UPI0025F80AD5|nr:restriction endonuclease subunit S [uncultured Alistipes sp.]